MGAFDDDRRAALASSYETGEERIAAMLDGKEPAPKAVPVAVQAAKPAPPPADTGPGFWSRLGSGISSAAGKAVDLVDKVEIIAGPISGARGNGAASVAPPPSQEPRWGMIMGWAAAAVVLLAILTRR